VDICGIYLRVREEEDGRLVLASGGEHEPLKVVVEGGRVVGARDLDRET